MEIVDSCAEYKMVASFASARAIVRPRNKPVAPGGALGALILWWICFKRKKKAIGGWLLYFLINLFGGAVVSGIILAFSVENLAPSAWADSKLYSLFLISSIPSYVVIASLVVVAVLLLRTRDWRWVRVMRAILVGDILFGLLGLAIDTVHFPNSVFFDVYGLIFPSIFLPYLIVSKRVERVFKTKDWAVKNSASSEIP